MEAVLILLSSLSIALIGILAYQSRREVEHVYRVNADLMKLLRAAQNKAISRDIHTFSALQGLEDPAPLQRKTRSDQDEYYLSDNGTHR